MTNPKHTPGPWTTAVYKVTPPMLERLTVGSLHHAVCTNHTKASAELLVALCGDEPGADSQSAADARLISAAPELLQALETLLTQLTSDSGEPTLDALEAASAAIAKAKGE